MAKDRYWLRVGDDSLDDAEPHHTLRDARLAFAEVAHELDRYGQRIDASIHIGKDAEYLVEYPDYVLSLGPRGGIRQERA